MPLESKEDMMQDSIPFATLIALETYKKTGDANMAMQFFREYGGMEA